MKRQKPSGYLPSLSYNRKASLNSFCMASASSSTMNLAANVINSSNSNRPDSARNNNNRQSPQIWKVVRLLLIGRPPERVHCKMKGRNFQVRGSTSCCHVPRFARLYWRCKVELKRWNIQPVKIAKGSGATFLTYCQRRPPQWARRGSSCWRAVPSDVGCRRPSRREWIPTFRGQRRRTPCGGLQTKTQGCYFFPNLQYRSKVWTHFFSFFKTAVEIGPVG